LVSLACPGGFSYKPFYILYFFGGVLVISRRGLKLGLFACMAILASAVFFQFEWSQPLRVMEALYFLETGSAVAAVAMGLALLATI
jgi:hypothetical protein